MNTGSGSPKVYRRSPGDGSSAVYLTEMTIVGE